MKNILALFIILVFFAACSYEVKDLECSEIENIELFKKEGTGHLKGNLQFTNSNSKDMKILRTDASVYINQKLIGEIDDIVGEELAAKTPYTFNVDLNFDPNEVYPGFMATRLGSFGTTEVQVVLKGKIKTDLDDEKHDHVFEVSKSVKVKK